MTAKDFNKQVKAIADKYQTVDRSSHYQYEMPTICGKWMFSAEYVPRIKVAHIHSRFEKFNRANFIKYIGKFDKPSRFSHKWNKYSESPEYILDLLDETISNFEYLEKETN